MANLRYVQALTLPDMSIQLSGGETPWRWGGVIVLKGTINKEGGDEKNGISTGVIVGIGRACLMPP